MGEILEKINEVQRVLQENKPGDRSDEDRHFAILLTELEKFKALVLYYLPENSDY